MDITILPEEYRVLVPVDATIDELMEHLEAITDYARDMHQRLANSEHADNAQAAGAYGNLALGLLDTKLLIESGKLPPAKFGDMSDEAAEFARRRYAQVLSGNLTKLKWDRRQIAEHGILREKDAIVRYRGVNDIFHEAGTVKNWAAVGVTALISGSHSAIKKWVQLLLWKKKQRGGGRLPDAHQKIIQSR
jgi:hypothetical protein